VPYLNELGIEAIATEELLHWDARAQELMDWMKDHWSTWPKSTGRDDLAVPANLYDLREMAHWFPVFQQSPPNNE
jgi:hypothetical protein